MGTEMVAFSKKDDLHPVAAVVPSAGIIEHNVCVMEVYFPHFSAISRSVVVAWDRVPLLSAHMTGFPDQQSLFTMLFALAPHKLQLRNG